jgi:pimeloyl-ACP methyl ester carboxylesterase
VSTVVVYVHGLWLPGQESFLLRRRLGRALAADTHSFVYSSVGASVDANAMTLYRYLLDIRAEIVHLVAHSLGGLVILKLFEFGGVEQLAPGRIVLLGAPVQGSWSARRLARSSLGRHMMGDAAEALIATRPRRWDGARELGVIAGNRAMGIGRLLGPMGAPNDGTVLVGETALPGATQQLLLPVSHSEMPFSSRVARQTIAFLRDGRFAG